MFLLILFQLLLREPVDKIGFCTKEEQLKELIKYSLNVKDYIKYKEIKKNQKTISVISPHDDHLYAAPLYIDALKEIKAKVVIIFGVAHRAKNWGIEKKLIFEDFDGFKSPKGYLKIKKDLREFFIKNLKKEDFCLCRNCQAEEHSIEAIIPFLEYFNPEVEILPVLISPMDFDKIQEISKEMANLLSRKLEKNSLKLGEDLQIIISSDAVHYGDQDWGGKNYAPFGVGIEGLKLGKKRDEKITKKFLSGLLKPNKIKEFLYTLVEEKDPKNYKVPWCGRFSISFGLSFLYFLKEKEKIYGIPLSYGTSVEIGTILEEKMGLQTTAKADLHHWVGYLAMKFVIFDKKQK